jgi:hypothetical protein
MTRNIFARELENDGTGRDICSFSALEDHWISEEHFVLMDETFQSFKDSIHFVSELA